MNKNIKNYIIIFLLIIIVLETALFFVKNNKKAVKKEETNNKVEELSLNNDLVKKLHYFTEDLFTPERYSFYQQNKVTLDNLNYDEKIMSLFFRNDSLDNDYDDFQNVVVGFEKMGEDRYYSKRKILDTGKKLFGENYDIEFIEDKLIGNGICNDFEYKNGLLIHHISKNCGGEIPYFNKRKLIKAEKDNNYIYLYDKYFFINDNSSGEYPEGIYDTSEMKNMLKEFDENEYGFAVKFEDYEDLANTFKHTFKKDTDGNYYWVSSEMMK